MPTTHVTIRRDADGYWFVVFPDVAGCFTQGRTLAQARSRIRDALATHLERDVDDLKVVERVELLKG